MWILVFGSTFRISGSHSNFERAVAPFSNDRTAKMNVLTSCRRKVRLVEKPSPVFAPVIRIVLPFRLV